MTVVEIVVIVVTLVVVEIILSVSKVVTVDVVTIGWSENTEGTMPYEKLKAIVTIIAE